MPVGTCSGGGFKGGIWAKIPIGNRIMADKTKAGRRTLCTIFFPFLNGSYPGRRRSLTQKRSLKSSSLRRGGSAGCSQFLPPRSRRGGDWRNILPIRRSFYLCSPCRQIPRWNYVSHFESFNLVCEWHNTCHARSSYPRFSRTVLEVVESGRSSWEPPQVL